MQNGNGNSSSNGSTKPQAPQTAVERRRQLFRSFEAKSLRSRSLLTQISDDLTSICGSTPFLIFHIIFFSGWIGVNTGWIPYTIPFDPFPFGLLTMVVSLEAIFLAIFILVSQNRSSYVNSLREEVHLRVNLIAEEEITKALEVLNEIRTKIGIKKEDSELEGMIKRIDTNYLEQTIQNQIDRANKPLTETFRKDFIQRPFKMARNLATNGTTLSPQGSKESPEKKS